MTPKQFFVVLGAIMSLVVVGGGTGYYFASNALHEGTLQLSQKLADESLADNKLQQLKDLSSQYHRLQPALEQLDAALPTTKKQSELSLQIQNLASQSGMTIKSISFPPSTAPGVTSQTVPAGSALAIPVTFQLRGNYSQLQAFLHRQESLNRYTSMTSLGIGGNNTGDVLTFDIQLNGFLKP